MDDQSTITGAPVDTGVQVTQPVEAVQAPAVNETQTSEQPQAEPSEDDNSEWLKSKGINLEEPDAARKLAKAYREAERNITKSAQRTAELEKSVAITQQYIPADASAQELIASEIMALKVQNNIRSFYENNPEAKAFDKEMGKYINENPNLGSMVKQGLLSLDQVYAMVRGNSANSLKSEGGREALEALASKQRAAVPSGSAVNSQVSQRQEEDPFMRGFNNKD